jgi:Flp pilus assembly protein TadG
VVEGALTLEVPAAPQAAREPSRPHAADKGLLPRLWRSERGTAVVEFALVAPLLFLLVFGVIDFARALNYYNNLTQIAGQGARAAAVNRNPDGTAVGDASLDGNCPAQSIGPPSTAKTIQCQLAKSYTSPELRSKVDVCIPSLPTTTGDPVTVRATFSFKFIPLVRAVAIRLAATSTERFEAAKPTYASGDFTVGGTAGDACSP